MHRLDGARLLAMPFQQPFGLPVPQVRPYREVLHRFAVGKQFLLFLANSYGDGPQRLPIAIRRRLFRKVVHLRAFLYRSAVFAVGLPLFRGNRFDSFPQCRIHARAHRKTNEPSRAIGPLLIAHPTQQFLFVTSRIPTEVPFLNRPGQHREPSLRHPQRILQGRHVAVPELFGHHHVHLRPQRHHRLIPAAALVGGFGLPLPTFDHGGIHIDGRDAFPGAAPRQLTHHILVHLRQAAQCPAVFRHIANLVRRQFPLRLLNLLRIMELIQEFSCRLGAGYRMSQHRCQSPVFTQTVEVFQTIAASGVEHQKALDIGGFIEAAVPLLQCQVALHTAGYIQRPRGTHE